MSDKDEDFMGCGGGIAAAGIFAVAAYSVMGLGLMLGPPLVQDAKVNNNTEVINHYDTDQIVFGKMCERDCRKFGCSPEEIEDHKKRTIEKVFGAVPCVQEYNDFYNNKVKIPNYSHECIKDKVKSHHLKSHVFSPPTYDFDKDFQAQTEK